VRGDEFAFLNSKFCGFSCPQEGLDEEFLGLVAVTYAREITRLFLSRYATELTCRGHGLVDLVEDWLNRDITFEMVWDPAVSNTFRAIQTGSAAQAINNGAALALRASASGVPGEWSLAFVEPVRLQWGPWLLPTADRIAVSCDGNVACVRTRLDGNKKKTSFTCTNDGWRAENAQIMPQFGAPYKKITVLPASALASGGLAPSGDPLPVAEYIRPEIIGVYREAVTLLAEYTPVYLPWILRVLCYVAPLHGDNIRSGSVEDQFGIICVSLGLNAVELAESFVHEASHQYLNLLCRLGPVDDGTDTNSYYSPAMRKERPLNRIVLAYHAYANILLFYRLCRAKGIADGDYCARRESELVSQVEQLGTPLRTNQALTSIGHGLCDPLIERLRAASIGVD
jgi:hypothetical protein